MNYTDNTKGFRRRKVLVKLEYLSADILCYINDIEELVLCEELDDNEYDYNIELLEELENRYSFVRGLHCLLVRGNCIKKFDLEECNYIREELLQLVTI